MLVLGKWKPHYDLIRFYHPDLPREPAELQGALITEKHALVEHGTLIRRNYDYDYALVLKGMLASTTLARYGLSPVERPTLINLKTGQRTSWPRWSPESHQFHREKLKQRVYQVLLGHYDSNSPLSRLDNHCLLLVLGFV